MRLSRWNPVTDLATFEVERLNEMFDRAFGAQGWAPVVDIFETPGRDFVVKVELPGLKKEDINLSLHDGVLSVSGERKAENERKEGETFRSERYFGRFQRSVTLPASVNAGEVKASYKDGVLTIDLPKAEEAKPRQIAVNVS